MGRRGTGRSHTEGQEWEEDQALQGWSSQGEQGLWGQQGTLHLLHLPVPNPFPPVPLSPALCGLSHLPRFLYLPMFHLRPQSPPSTPTHCPSQPAYRRASCNTASPAFPPPPALSPDLPLDRGPDHPMEWVGCCSLSQEAGVRVGSLQGSPEPQCTALPSP